MRLKWLAVVVIAVGVHAIVDANSDVSVTGRYLISAAVVAVLLLGFWLLERKRS